MTFLDKLGRFEYMVSPAKGLMAAEFEPLLNAWEYSADALVSIKNRAAPLLMLEICEALDLTFYPHMFISGHDHNCTVLPKTKLMFEQFKPIQARAVTLLRDPQSADLHVLAFDVNLCLFFCKLVMDVASEEDAVQFSFWRVPYVVYVILIMEAFRHVMVAEKPNYMARKDQMPRHEFNKYMKNRLLILPGLSDENRAEIQQAAEIDEAPFSYEHVYADLDNFRSSMHGIVATLAHAIDVALNDLRTVEQFERNTGRFTNVVGKIIGHIPGVGSLWGTAASMAGSGMQGEFEKRVKRAQQIRGKAEYVKRLIADIKARS